jgi:hypothetical protein
MGKPGNVLLTMLLGSLTACSRPPLLAGGPIALSERPTTVHFMQPVLSNGHTWELCFEFELPGDSHRAATIHATLVSSSGSRATIRTPTLDRRGESTVCQFGQVTPAESGTEGSIYKSVELYADGPLNLRGIRGGSRS